MQKEIDQFVKRTQQLSARSGLASGIGGSTHYQTVIADLNNAAAQLPKAASENKLNEQLDEVVGVLHVAQAMNIIGFDDLAELMDLLDNIKDEEK